MPSSISRSHSHPSRQCLGITKKGTQCRRAARKGSTYCASHARKGGSSSATPAMPAATTIKTESSSPRPRSDEVLAFLDMAREDLLQLGRMRGQFCTTATLDARVQVAMAAEETALLNIVERVPIGLKSGSLDVPALRHEFHTHHRALSRLILTECSVRLPTGRLANLKATVQAFLRMGAAARGPCATTPRALRQWYEDTTTDRVWVHKRLLCSELPDDALLAFRPGQVLWDGFEVVMVGPAAGRREATRWIAVAKRRADDGGAPEAEAATNFARRLVECMEGSRRIALQMVRTTLATLDRLLRMAARSVGRLPRVLARMVRRYYKYALIILVAGLCAYPALLKVYPSALESAVTGQVNDAITVLANPPTYANLTAEARDFAHFVYTTAAEAAAPFRGYVRIPPPLSQATDAVRKEVEAWAAASGDRLKHLKGHFDEVVAGCLATLQQGGWWSGSPSELLPLVATPNNALALPPRPLFPPTPPPPPPPAYVPTPLHLLLVPVGGVHEPAKPFDWKRGLATWRTARQDGERTGLALYTSSPTLYKEYLDVLQGKRAGTENAGRLLLPQTNLLKAYMQQHPKEAKEYIAGVAVWRKGVARALDRMAAEAREAAEAELAQGRDFRTKIVVGSKAAWVKIVDARDALQVQRRKLAAFVHGFKDAQYLAFRAWLATDGRRIASGFTAGLEKQWTKVQRWYDAHGDAVKGLLYRHFSDPARGLRPLDAAIAEVLAKVQLQRQVTYYDGTLPIPASSKGRGRPLSTRLKLLGQLYHETLGGTKDTRQKLERLAKAVVLYEGGGGVVAGKASEIVAGLAEVNDQISAELRKAAAPAAAKPVDERPLSEMLAELRALNERLRAGNKRTVENFRALIDDVNRLADQQMERNEQRAAAERALVPDDELMGSLK